MRLSLRKTCALGISAMALGCSSDEPFSGGNTTVPSDNTGVGGAFTSTGNALGVGGSTKVTAPVGAGTTGTIAATGGTLNGGGTKSTTPSVISACAEANKSLENNDTGKHCGYTYEYWKDQGTGTLVLTPDGFTVEWNGINNLLGRKGIRPGSADLVVTYDADYKPDGNSYLCVYGWTKNPLIEYYIVDSWGTWRPPGSTSLGTVESDGGTYDIYKTERKEQPSIEGTKTFYQYWSVRKVKREKGIITAGNHFTAWAAKGMNMGAFYEVSMTVEGYQSNGKATVKMLIE